jgi:predicted HTH transcriptional regulator
VDSEGTEVTRSTAEERSHAVAEARVHMSSPSVAPLANGSNDAMLNTEGGTMLIGVGDDGSGVGIDLDLATLKRADVDEYERTLRQGFIDLIGVEYSPYVRVTFPEFDGVRICRVDVDPSPKPAFLAGKQDREFYIRSGNASRPLDPAATHEYIQMHWG